MRKIKRIKYHWLWLEYDYLAKRVEYRLGHIDRLQTKLNELKKELEDLKTRLFFLEHDVRAELASTGTRPITKEPIDKVKLNELIEKMHKDDEK